MNVDMHTAVRAVLATAAITIGIVVPATVSTASLPLNPTPSFSALGTPEPTSGHGPVVDYPRIVPVLWP